jgi:hypothetical protein
VHEAREIAVGSQILELRQARENRLALAYLVCLARRRVSRSCPIRRPTRSMAALYARGPARHTLRPGAGDDPAGRLAPVLER